MSMEYTYLDIKVNVCGCTYNFTAKNVEEEEEQMEDEGTILRRMHRLTDYYDIHKEIGRSETLPQGHSCLYFHYY